MHVLDASGFYAGVPFGSTKPYCTTPEIYDEVRHIKARQRAIEALMDAGRLSIRAPDGRFVKAAIRQATHTGDITRMSSQDVSVLALAMETKCGIVTDDYALSNAASLCGIHVHPVMSRGLRRKGIWIYMCPACSQIRKPASECHVCGTALRRRLSGSKTA